MESGSDDPALVARALAGEQQAFDALRAAAETVVRGTVRMQVGRFEEAAACIGEVAAIQPGPAVEAARQACLAGLPSHKHGPPGGSGTILAPIDDLDLRT